MATRPTLSGHRMQFFSDPATGEGSIYQVVRTGHDVIVAMGHRGGELTYTTHDFATELDARTFIGARVQDRIFSEGYVTAFQQTDTYFDTDRFTNPVDAFYHLWRQATWADTPPGHRLGSRWVLATGLLAEQAYDLRAATLLESLTDGPHTIDVERDRVIGRAVMIPEVGYLLRTGVDGSLDSFSHRASTAVLGPTEHPGTPLPGCCTICCKRLPALLAYLLDPEKDRPSAEHRRRVLDTARRLAHQHA